MLLRERTRARAAVMPAPVPLPSLRDALARRAAVFGPYDLDEAPVAPRGLRARVQALVDLLMPRAPC